jgi:hypothetical protein
MRDRLRGQVRSAQSIARPSKGDTRPPMLANRQGFLVDRFREHGAERRLPPRRLGFERSECLL